MPEPSAVLRERTRRAVQVELLAVAVELFLSKGYEATTVEQLAAAAGLSRRSFFRYFASKDDVLAQALVEVGADIAKQLAERPADELPWPALRRAFDQLVTGMTDDARALPLTRLILESPALHARHIQKQAAWRTAIAAALSPRLSSGVGGRQEQIHADAVSAAALACFMSAQAAWIASDGQSPLTDLLDQAMGAVAAAATVLP